MFVSLRRTFDETWPNEEKAATSGLPIKFTQNYQNALANASRPKKPIQRAYGKATHRRNPMRPQWVKGIELPSVTNAQLAASDLSVPNLQPP